MRPNYIDSLLRPQPSAHLFDDDMVIELKAHISRVAGIDDFTVPLNKKKRTKVKAILRRFLESKGLRERQPPQTSKKKIRANLRAINEATIAARKTRQRGERKPKMLESGKNFYRTEEWKVLRYTALKAANGRCMLCGASSHDAGVVLRVDHIKAVTLRPDLKLDPTNLQVLCTDCNWGKNRDDGDFRPEGYNGDKIMAENDDANYITGPAYSPSEAARHAEVPW